MARTEIRPNYAGLMALRHHVQKIHDSIVEDVESDAQTYAAVDTGEMRSTIRSYAVRPLLFILAGARLIGFSAESRVEVGSDHWHLVEYPTAAHEIRPRTPGGVLFWPGAPHPVQVVHHPGTTEQPFMRPALYKQRSLRGRP